LAEPSSQQNAINEGRRRSNDTRATIAYGIAFLAIAGAAAVLALGSSWFEMEEKPAPEAPNFGVRYVDSVAVMPFDNLTGDSQYDHLGIGITEEIITQLAGIRPLKVISRHSVEAVDRQNLTIPQVASALGVRHIIEGSVRLEGDTLRISLQHINAETDSHTWTETFQGSIRNPIAVQEEVARLVTDRIVEMIPGISQPAYSSHVNLGPGQEAYLSGRRYLGQRTSDGLNKAIEQFVRAIELDPEHAPAYADLASAYALTLIYRYDIGMSGYEAAARSMAYAERALKLDANLAAGYAARGFLGVYINRPAADVAADFDRAAELQPNAASIPSWRALSLARLGRTEEALSEAARAVELDPLAPSRHVAVASISFEMGRFDDAVAAGRMATTLEPRMIRGRALEARSMILDGRAASCAKLILGPHRVLRATCLELNGQAAEAETIVDTVLTDIAGGNTKSAGFTEVTNYEDLAVLYALRGDAQSALTWAERAFSLSPTGIEPRLLKSAMFDAVRDDQGFSTSIEAIRSGIYDRVRRASRDY